MFGIEPQVLLFAVLFVVIGVLTILRRTLTVGEEGEDSNRQVHGSLAVALGCAIIVAGLGLFVSKIFGFSLFCIVLVCALIAAR